MFNWFKSKDKKPVMLSLLWQRDECSRMVGDFVEKDLPGASQVIITFVNGDKDNPVVIAAGCDSEVEAAGILMKGAHKVAGHGI